MEVVAPSSPRYPRDQALLSYDAVGGLPVNTFSRLAACVGPRRDAPVAIGAAETLLGMHLARRWPDLSDAACHDSPLVRDFMGCRYRVPS